METPRPRRLVIDTNALLDWLLFDDPAMRPIGAALEAGRLVWLVSPALRDELEHVLARGVGASRQPDVALIRRTWRHLGRSVAQPMANSAGPRLRCSDPDDQKFIDLAVVHRADVLLSRDRAVLKLHRRASAQGLTITAPLHLRFEPP